MVSHFCPTWSIAHTRFPLTRPHAVHTYYKTVAYWLPRPVMTPLWESPKVAVRDGNGEWQVATTPNYALNYHRAYYTRDYGAGSRFVDSMPPQALFASPSL